MKDYQVMCKSLLVDSQSDNVMLRDSLLASLEDGEAVGSPKKRATARSQLFGLGTDYV